MGSMARFSFGKWAIVIIAIAAWIVQGCTSSDFKVNIELKGLGNQNVRVVYRNAEGGIADSWIMAQNDAVEITGNCTDPSLLMVYNSMSVPIARLVVSGGDKLEVKGEGANSNQLQVKGSDVMEQWNDFVVKHRTEYDMSNAVKLNAEIEKYVKDNPKSVVSTVLVMLDYSPGDDSAIDKLLDKIDDSAKPESLMASYNLLKSREKKPTTKITSLNIFEQGSGDFESAKIAGNKPSVIVFWDRDLSQNKRKMIFEEMKMLDAAQVQVLDISLDIDSTGWYYATHQDGTTWKHYWVPGSMMNGEIVSLQVNTTPTIIVTDSLGNQLYRGQDAIIARQTVEDML